MGLCFLLHYKEGDLDKKLASLVNRKRCVEISNYLSLKDYVLVGDNKENSKIENKILADTVESIVGALYLDQGLEVAEKFILNYWKRFLNEKLTYLSFLSSILIIFGVFVGIYADKFKKV